MKAQITYIIIIRDTPGIRQAEYPVSGRIPDLTCWISGRIHCPKGFPTLPVYTGNVEDQTPPWPVIVPNLLVFV
jgi:hypothetical protein